ncbi:histidine phosphatase family protein [Bacillus sp. EB106-08-02-XG196]|jgi:alpha-ribazole phosphatase|uniref:histidine phosphatase family protein n=1 Tax=Bacillus sp. EB106-08-02-XG196 TaxID=2737049 RepID=UPI0015C4E3D4|nr:histidine phosphatase family protein [Bacillus sp. EB106-08-02-XG196]NWQ41578.1 histidine phosphatase family protein [Bacillus sp. EB106-08-02-XG196]
MDDSVVIALFRHGLTEENKRKAYLGWNDSPLCKESFDLSTKSRYNLYFSSDLPRCITTATILFPNKELILLPNLREMNFGRWEGKTYEDLKEVPLYQRWLSNPISYCPPEGESFDKFTHRVQNGWEEITGEILSKNVGRCAIITHGGIIRYLLSEFAPQPRDFWSWQVQHHQGFELVFDREALRRRDRCTLLREVPLTAKEHG